MNAARDELAEIIQDVGEYIPGSHADDYISPVKAADAILAAGYSRPRTVSTVEELEALPEGSVIRDKFNDVSERRDGYWCGYETAPLSDRLVKKYLPASVLYEPEGK